MAKNSQAKNSQPRTSSPKNSKAKTGRTKTGQPKTGGRDTAVYTLRGSRGEITYIGSSNDLGRRASEHERSGKRGSMRKETSRMTQPGARRREAERLETYRRNHGGKNPPHNKTRHG